MLFPIWSILQNLVLPGEDVVGEDGLLHILKAQTGDGVGEALAGQAVLPVEEDGLLHHIQDLLLGGEELAQGGTLAHLLAPAAADADLPGRLAGTEGIEQALSGAAAAVVAEALVDDDLAVNHSSGLHGAAFSDPALAAAPALLQVHFLDPLADDAQIVQVGLDAVVGAAAGGDLELVGQLHAVIAQVEALMDLLAEAEGVIKAGPWDRCRRCRGHAPPGMPGNPGSCQRGCRAAPRSYGR